MCFVFPCLNQVCGIWVWGVPLALFKHTVLKGFVCALDSLDILVYSPLQRIHHLVSVLVENGACFSASETGNNKTSGAVLNARMACDAFQCEFR